MSKKVGIILVNYKDYVNRFLAECRDSLREQTYSDFRVYIVDNASTKETRDYIKDNYPEAVVLPRKDGNYSAANNLGIKRAGDDGCQYFVIANMDTSFDCNWLKELVLAMDDKKEAAFIQSKILFYPQEAGEGSFSKINSLGNIINFLGFGFTSFYSEPDREIKGFPEIGYASGCSFITTKEVIDKIGYYDEEYWMYHDDLEMGWRARLAGYKIYLAPESVVYHKYEFSRSIRMLYYMERNRYLSILHYYRWPTLVLISPAILAMELGMILYSIPGKWFLVKMRSNLYFLNPFNWIKIFRKRGMVKKVRNRKDREVMISFQGRIMFQEIDNPVLKYLANPILDLYWNIIKKIIIW